MEQVLVRTTDAGFTGQDPAIGSTGLTQLQIWQGEGGSRLVLLAVNDRKAATEWLRTQRDLGHVTSAEFLRTI